jgi:hypothetical protein
LLRKQDGQQQHDAEQNAVEGRSAFQSSRLAPRSEMATLAGPAFRRVSAPPSCYRRSLGIGACPEASSRSNKRQLPNYG